MTFPSQVNLEYSAGDVIHEKFRVEGKINSGSFGTVYKAMHLGLERMVALKLLHYGG